MQSQTTTESWEIVKKKKIVTIWVSWSGEGEEGEDDCYIDNQNCGIHEFKVLLGWPKNSLGFFLNILWKNPN